MFCPKCGVPMTTSVDGTTLECVPGGMELSAALHAGLVEVFVARQRRAKQISLRWGDGWFCPGCGVPMIADHEHVRCPRCGEHLDEFLHYLIELHPHRHRLLVVEHAFELPNGGVVLSPGVPLAAARSEAVSVEVRRPDGSSARARGKVFVPLGQPAPMTHVRLEDTTKADVPPGTEVWLLS